jgi:acyl-CoA reductase-like NAD-dependent aldehyde dehydrogenase
LFDKETRVKFRGTHLLDNEEAFDHDEENTSSFPQAYRGDIREAIVAAKRSEAKAWRKRSSAEVRFITKRLFFS